MLVKPWQAAFRYNGIFQPTRFGSCTHFWESTAAGAGPWRINSGNLDTACSPAGLRDDRNLVVTFDPQQRTQWSHVWASDPRVNHRRMKMCSFMLEPARPFYPLHPKSFWDGEWITIANTFPFLLRWPCSFPFQPSKMKNGIDFQVVNTPPIPWLNLSCSWCVLFIHYIVGLNLLKSCLELLHPCSQRLLIHHYSFLVVIFVWC